MSRVSEPEQPVMAHTFHSCFLSFMLEVSFVYLAYEGTQLGAEKMVLLAKESLFSTGANGLLKSVPLSSEYHRVWCSADLGALVN